MEEVGNGRMSTEYWVLASRAPRLYSYYMRMGRSKEQGMETWRDYELRSPPIGWSTVRSTIYGWMVSGPVDNFGFVYDNTVQMWDGLTTFYFNGMVELYES